VQDVSCDVLVDLDSVVHVERRCAVGARKLRRKQPQPRVVAEKVHRLVPGRELVQPALADGLGTTQPKVEHDVGEPGHGARRQRLDPRQRHRGRVCLGVHERGLPLVDQPCLLVQSEKKKQTRTYDCVNGIPRPIRSYRSASTRTNTSLTSRSARSSRSASRCLAASAAARSKLLPPHSSFRRIKTPPFLAYLGEYGKNATANSTPTASTTAKRTAKPDDVMSHRPLICKCATHAVPFSVSFF